MREEKQESDPSSFTFHFFFLFPLRTSSQKVEEEREGVEKKGKKTALQNPPPTRVVERR